MIIELLMSPLFLLVKFFISLLPDGYSLPGWSTSTIGVLTMGMKVFPADVWLVITANILFWLTVHFGWALIEWVYKKIPGVD